VYQIFLSLIKFLVKSTTMSDAEDCFGNLLYYKKRAKPCDPFNGLKVVTRLGEKDKSLNTWSWTVPDDKLPLKFDKCQLEFDAIMPENYVPDNDIAAKAISKLSISIMDTEIFSSYAEGLEYLWFNHCLKKLNYSPQAQEIELFPEGHFDSYELDACDLKTTLVKENGLNCVDNRQQYAKTEWKRPEKSENRSIKFGTDCDPVEFEVCHHRYNLRSPISHGLARQPSVLPPNSKVAIDAVISTTKTMLLRHSDYVMCRVYNASEITGDRTHNKFPYVMKGNSSGSTSNAQLKAAGYLDDEENHFSEQELQDKDGDYEPLLMVEEFEVHLTEDDCDCATKNAANKTKIESGEYTGLAQEVPIGATADGDLTKLIVHGTDFRPHSIIKKVPKVEKQTIDGHEYGIFWKRNVKIPEKNKNCAPHLENVKMMNVFCNPRQDEKPLATSIKGQAKIPFFFPRLKNVSLAPGLRTYEIELSAGPIPYMIIFSGMPHFKIDNPSFTKCVTKTTMHEPGFKIKEFEILVDNYNAFLTPWKEPISHYTNFLMHNGRYINKSVGGGLDFFNFQNQNWMVPMLFDDRQNENATINARITFEAPLTKTWDAMILKIPIDYLVLDKIRRGMYIF
jgi:hypothetical protein